MRIDKFLKNSRIVKRRTIAKEACESGKILLNGKIAKPGSEVKCYDVIEITFGKKIIRIRVEKIDQNPSKENAQEMYTEL